MASNQNSTEAAQSLPLHEAENQTEATIRTRRYQRAFNNTRYIVALIVTVVIFIVIIRSFIIGSSQEVEQIPVLLKQLLDIAPIWENPAWQNVTSRL